MIQYITFLCILRFLLFYNIDIIGNDSILSDHEDYNYCNTSNWAVNHNISNVAANDLLIIFLKHHCFKTLPKDSRTLTDLSSKKIEVKNVEPGSYFHFGIAKCIKIFYPIQNHINP